MAGADEVYYEVDSLLDKRIGKGSRIEYLVHWKGFTSEWDTWEPANNLDNCRSRILKFEKQWKKRKASTQKYVLKLVNKSKMARFDLNKVTSVKANTKQGKKKMTAKPKKKKSLNTSTTLDDVFESVIEGKTASVKKKAKGQIIDKKISVSPIKKAVSAKKKSDGSIEPGSNSASGKPSLPEAKKSIKSIKKGKRGVGVKPLSSAKKLAANKQDSSKKIDNKTSMVKVKKKLENSPQVGGKQNSPKKAGDKRWRAVDEEVSFSSDNDLSPGPSSAKKSKNEVNIEKKLIPKKLNTKVVSEVTKSAKINKKSSPSKSKNISGKVIVGCGSPKSAFKIVSKKKNAFKISVNHLVGASKKSETDKSNSESMKGSEKNKPKKKTLKAMVPKKRNIENSVVSILTDDESDSDCEILYSLSDTSDLAINYLKSSPADKTDVAAGRSKSEGSLESNLSKKEKVLKKSKSTSENVDKVKIAKKIKLLDSLKQITSTSVSNLVRPVSPTPVYTTVKHTNLDGTLLPDAQPLLAQPQWVIDDDSTPTTAQSASLPISPASMSYKDLLENLPSQLHPKNKKKTSGSDDSSDIERRISVRASECAFKYKDIVIKKCQKYTQIWLNTHTKMKNAINPSVMQEISAALNASKYDDSTLVMFSGLGNVFCSGIDLHYLTVGDRKVASKKMADALRELVHKFITFPKLLVAVVTGPAIGMGSALLPLCDIVYASDKATFYMPYAQLSQTPEGCASFTLPHIVGTAMANELLIGGRKITAIEACQLGFVSQVYWPTSMMQEVIPRVQHMALLSGKVLETTKLLMRSHQRTKLDLSNESECNLLMERWPANECQRAIEEFLSNEKNYML